MWGWQSLVKTLFERKGKQATHDKVALKTRKRVPTERL